MDRHSFWSAMSVAAGLIVIAYAMDWFLFGAVRIERPDFFPIVAIGLFALRLPILSVRRLHDADRSGWLTLALLAPIAGWLLLTRYWWAPSIDRATATPSRPLRPASLVCGQGGERIIDDRSIEIWASSGRLFNSNQED